ncbi:uncharacterized protein LOC116851006 [Odontomachus brunneus]|uniref:uncharacterized protein LOC116851006 n=1 Tax=Odontomachus brunneus TaxID=486640 RepID=UPI0013F1B0B8|nr:uncharacterized protein LOC116851006 [Odontomachus brunneus]
MQNWNQWQLSAGAVTTPVPQPPLGYAAAAATAAAASATDSTTLMQNYMQYYNQPAPSGYTAEQWATAQQQNWSQWQQWQQQYQQWQAQYGDKYHDTMKHLSAAQNINLAASQAPLPHMQLPPPLPKEDTARPPPLPPATTNVAHQFTNMPPPHQNNLPLFPTKESATSALPQVSATSYLPPSHPQPQPPPPPLPSTSQPQQPPPLPPETESKRELPAVGQAEKRDSNASAVDGGESNSGSSAKKLKLDEDEELTETEKTFDAQFKQWEQQFNKWKLQNANHPDKTQYKQYEAKWTSWREKLLERREQMRKKREQQKQAAATKASTTAEPDKNKSASDDKILNILSNTENQHLINNLLGIGKSLGLTGKQQSATAAIPSLPPPPPPPPETTTSGNQAETAIAVQGVQQVLPQQNMVGSNVAVPPPSWPVQQQWENNQQYNPRMEAPNYGMPPSVMHHHPTAMFVHPMTSPNFTQPPPSLPSNNTGPPPNFSQPPPNYPPNNNNNNNQERLVALQNAPRGPASAQDQPPNMDMRFARHPNDRGSNFDAGQQSNFPRRVGEPPDHRFPAGRGDGIANPSGNEQEQFMRPGDTAFARPNEPFNDRIEAQQQRFRRGDRGFPGDFGNNPPNGSMNFQPSNEGRFGPPTNERFAGGNNRFGPDRFPPPSDRPFASEHDRFGGVDRFSGGERFVGSEADRFARGKEHTFDRPDNERFGQNDRFERFPEHKDRFPLAGDRFAPNVNEHFAASDRFGRGNNPGDSFDPKDVNDHRRDAFGSNSRLFGRNPVFSPPKELPPELRKLMEKRKAASDVFKPSFLSDPEKLSVGSLSESFKKIAGDSPFRSSFDFPKIRPGGPSSMNNFPSVAGSRTPPPFQPHPFAPDPATSPYGHHNPRGGFPFNPLGNTLDNEPPVSPISGFKQGPFVENFAKHNVPVDYNEQETENGKREKNAEGELQNPNQQAQPTDIQSQSSANYRSENPEADINIDSANNMEIDNVQDVQDMEVTQPKNEVDSAAVEQKENLNVEGDLPKEIDDNRKADDIPDLSGNDDGFQDKQEQQDNKDEDNSSELRKSAENNTDNKDENISSKKPESLPFMGENDPRPEDLNIEPPPELPNLGPIRSSPGSEPQHVAESCNEAFDGKGPPAGAQFHDTRPRGMEFPRMGPSFRFLGPPPLFNSRGPQGFLLPSHDSNSQLGPRDGQFGSNAAGDVGQFSPRRPNEEQYTERGRNNESFNENSRNPNSGQFGSMNEPFPRNLTGKFGQVGLRGLVDLPFAPRHSSLLGPRGNDMQFASRGGLSDTHRHPGDGSQFSFLGSNNNNRFGRPNETLLDRRPLPFGFPDVRPRLPVSEGPPPFGSRGLNDSILSGPRGPPPDTFSQGRRSPKAFSENRFDSRDFNEGSFESDRSLPVRGPMDDLSHTRDYMRRSGPYTRREQFKNDTFENPAAKSDEPFNRNMGQQNTELRMDNVEYTRRIPPSQDSHKKDVDKKPSNEVQFEERSRLEPKTTDFGDNNNKELTDPKFHGPNLFTKHPQSMLSAGGGSGEFCAPRQFNYNHGEISGSSGEKKVIEYTPSKVIDYGHTSRPAVVDQHLSSPVQCFDYAHGDSKPVEHQRDQYQSRKDFRNWVKNEQSIKDYAEQMSNCYENAKKEHAAEKAKCGSYDARRLAASDFTKQRMKDHHMDWQHHQASDRRTCGEWETRESEDRKERSLMYDPLEEQRFFDRDSNASDGQGDRNARRERIQETCETSRRETNKDSDKDDSRSKGSINWQENLNKNTVDTKLLDTSLPDTKKNVAESTTTPKTLELAKMPNYTMVDDLVCPPGRQNRPPKIAIILRGPPGSGKSFVAKLIKDKEVEQGGSAPRILSLDDYFLVEKEVETKDDNGKKMIIKEMVYEYEEAMEQSYIMSLVKAFKKNILDGFFNFIILDCINERISDYEEMWSFAKTKGFKVYVCEMEMDLQICLKRNIHNRTEDEINRIIDYFEPTPSYHLKLDVNSMLQEQAIEEVDMEDSQQEIQEISTTQNEDSQDSHEDTQDAIGVSKWEKMEAEDKLDRLDGLARKKNEARPQTMEDFLQVPDYYNMEDTSGKKRVRWADLEERKEQEKMRAVGFVVGHTNWDRMMDPTKGGSALTRTKFFSPL